MSRGDSPCASEPGQFSAYLRDHVMPIHKQVEGHPVMKDVNQRKLTLNQYLWFLSQLAYLYETLESEYEMRQAKSDFLRPFHDPQVLNRSEAVEHDLVELAGPAWREHYPPLKATREYMKSLKEGDDETLWSSHYVRYLGDLMGGQILRRRLKKVLGFTDRTGINFYIFDNVDSPVRYCKAYKAKMDQLGLPEEKRIKLAALAVEAFKWNEKMFDDIYQAWNDERKRAAVSNTVVPQSSRGLPPWTTAVLLGVSAITALAWVREASIVKKL